MLKVCPRCGSEWTTAIAMNGAPSEFWKECSNPNCNTYLNTYVPQEHQFAFHSDPHRIVGNFGGYGSGKTLTSREEAMKHFFITPKGNTVIGANVISQYEATLKREIEADIPAAFIKRVSSQKAYFDLINDHRVMFRPFDDPDKLRSYNVTQFIILEASEVKKDSFTQLRTRLRNMAASVQAKDENGELKYKKAKNGTLIPIAEHDWRKGIIESNPDSGWIRDDVLLASDHIERHGTVYDVYDQLEAEKDPMISSHVTSTDANEYLPRDFIQMNSKNKAAWWVQKYIYGSFLYAQGTVYPGAATAVCAPVEVKPEWRRIIAFDYGLVDPSVFLFGAIDELNNILYIYKEVRETDNNIEQLAYVYKKACEDIPLGGMLTTPIIDPKSGPKRDYDKKSLADHFLDFGIAFQPGFVNKDARIFRTNTYIESGKLKIFNTCTDLIRELREYKFQANDKMSSGFTEKPVDGNDHSISCLEWICMWLPADPKNMVYGIYDKMGRDLTKEKAKEHYGYWALSDEDASRPIEDTPFDVTEYNYNYF